MNLSFQIARRYLFAPKSHNAINIISMVSVCGVAVTTMALVCTLSVFNGFQLLITDLMCLFDPELKITPVKGKTFSPQTPFFDEIRSMNEVDVVVETLEERVLVEYKDRQVTSVVRGVTDNYERQIDKDKLIMTGEFKLRDESSHYVTIGAGLASQLGCYSAAIYPITVYSPRRVGRVNMANPAESFNVSDFFVAGVFSVNQPIYDEQYMIIPMESARELFDQPTEVSSLELKLTPRADITKVKKRIRSLAGMETFYVKDRYEQQEEAHRMTQIEKWMTFLILTFILLIAAFNIVGSLSMLMIDKRADARILSSLGATKQFIDRIFLFEGWLISASGAVMGVLLGVILCLLQEYFGLISLGDTSGAFITDAYPVKLLWSDIAVVLSVVGVIGFFAAWIPVRSVRR